MAALLKPGWIKPSSILFACEIPANQESFAFALAQAVEYGAKLILFHAYDMLVVSASEISSVVSYDGAAIAKPKSSIWSRWPSAYGHAGVECETVVRLGCRPTRFSPSCVSGRLIASSWAPTLSAP